MATPRVIVFGYDELLLASLDTLTELNAEISAVVFPSIRTDEKANAIRSNAAARGLTIMEMPAGNVDKFAAELQTLDADVFILWSFPMILPRTVIDVPHKGTVNIHMGLLPEYRGVNGVRWALFNGEARTGVTMHYIDEGIDTGDMIARAVFPIAADDDIRSLMITSRTAGIKILKHFWPQIISGTVVTQSQDHSAADYYSAKMEPEAEIDWGRTSVEIRDHIRAFTFPFKGAVTRFNTVQLKVTDASLTDRESSEAYGTILAVDQSGILVSTGDSTLLLTGIEIEGNTLSVQRLAAIGLNTGERFADREPSRGSNSVSFILGIATFLTSSDIFRQAAAIADYAVAV